MYVALVLIAVGELISTQVFPTFKTVSLSHLWFSQNGLVINRDKSDALHFSTAQRARKSTTKLVDVAGAAQF